MLHVMTSSAVLMNSHQGFSMAWKPMLIPLQRVVPTFIHLQVLSSLAFPCFSTAFDPTRLRRQNSHSPQRLRGYIPVSSTEHQQASTPSRLGPHALLVRLSSLWPRSRLDTDEETEPHPTTPSGSRPDALIDSLSSLFRSQSHTNEELQLSQYSRRPHVVEVAAVRDREVIFTAPPPPQKNTAADPIAHSGIIHDTICSRNQSYCTTSKTSVFTTRPIVGSSRAFSLLRISSTRHC
jgi:hypothetical protein